jgi:hypothetical protein
MSELPSEMYQVHAILERYVAIHDKLFKASWRKAIPIPGLFKAIDYGQHLIELNSLVLALEQLADSTSSRAGIPVVYQQYITALLKAIQFLRDMCRRLYDKSQGDLQSYSMGQYKSDVTAYDGLVGKYRELGLALNQYLRK